MNTFSYAYPVKQYFGYDEMVTILKTAGKEIVEFSGIMSNPTYAKVQEGTVLAKEKKVDFISVRL